MSKLRDMKERLKASVCEAERGGNGRETLFEERIPGNFSESKVDI